MQQVRSGFVVVVISLLAAACGGGTPPLAPDAVPESLRPPADELMTLKAHAKGVQIYSCRTAKDDIARYEWALLGPEATLTDPAGRKVARHFAGPTWAANDGSEVVGEVVARADSPGAIPMLLLKAKSTTGKGRFGGVRSIQRLNTVGGVPQAPCTAHEAGQEARVDYSADYYFYVAAAH
jgi:hypothetical protein